MLQNFFSSITFKAIVIGFLTLLLLIPSEMVSNLIYERMERSKETIEKINNKWSDPQTLYGPLLSIPFEAPITDAKNNTIGYERRILTLVPEELDIQAKLAPEVRYFGIFKAILYKSEVKLTGRFSPVSKASFDSNCRIQWDKAFLSLAVSDLRGMTKYPVAQINGSPFDTYVGVGKRLVIDICDPSMLQGGTDLTFDYTLDLNGSGSMHFIPVAKTTQVTASGAWLSPGFTGKFSPEYTIDKQGFQAKWNVLDFNRDIPGAWVENELKEKTSSPSIEAANYTDSYFGVNLVDTVDHYQQNMRSAKYAFMFIALTFLVFFIVELLTKRKVHLLQYVLVGFALIVFYTLLLSISEHISFLWAYLVASGAIIGLISAYAYSIFRSYRYTLLLSLVLAGLYVFLYVILQLEDMALLVGSISLFLILALVMYVSRKINWEQDSLPE